MPTALITDPLFKQHDPGWEHPESPGRYDAVMRAIHNEDLSDLMLVFSPRQATADEVALCHTRDYIRLVQEEIEAGITQLSTGDTAVSLRSYEVAMYAAGAVLRAVDAVMTGEARNSFCVVRPPGHHAGPDRGMGFCLFNNAAIGARYAQANYNVDRVLIVDWDVHHGNGTQDIFYGDPSVYYFSTHQAPLYPFTGFRDETGAGPGEGTTLNCPLPAGSGRSEIMSAFEDQLVPAMETFQPNLVILSAGFDSRVNDPLGHFTLTDGDFADLTRLMMKTAAQYCDSRVISVLEGGYNLHGLASACASHVRALLYGEREDSRR